MFDIGFLELVLIGAVALLVIGPERLPGAVRTGAMYLRRIKRSFNDIRQEVERELHNEEIMQELKQTRDQVSDTADQWRREINETGDKLSRDMDASAPSPEANESSDTPPSQEASQEPSQEKRGND